MESSVRALLRERLEGIRQQGLFKDERLIASPQNARVRLEDGREVINMCANNYLGLADDAEIIGAARQALDEWGFGMASVRFICGTQSLHKDLERRLSAYLGTEDTILYPSCFDANGGLFETLLGPEDAVFSDALNHASIIDGIRLSKARRFRYAHRDLEDLEAKLKEAHAGGARLKLIATDGVFSMDGNIAPVAALADLADRYGAWLMIDDCHATGFMGQTGRGTHEHCHARGRVDIITGTLGKALGGASGGFTSGPSELIELLRQHSRPYLFSNTLAPPIAAASLAVLERLERDPGPRQQLWENTRRWRQMLEDAGFIVAGEEHPIAPVMLGDAHLAQEMAARLLEEGVFAMGFFYPVVPREQARIRTQVSAAHSEEDLAHALRAFVKARESSNNGKSHPQQ